jgi:hypothetical protein
MATKARRNMRISFRRGRDHSSALSRTVSAPLISFVYIEDSTEAATREHDAADPRIIQVPT